MNRAILILLLSATAALAQQPWPNRIVDDFKLRPKRVPLATLPKTLRVALRSFDEISPDGERLPPTLEICRIDLNGDGTPEYIVSSPASYTGGTARIIYQRTKAGYQNIAYFQGGFHLTARHNGYYQVESWGRAGGGELTRTLERFEHGRYRLARIEDYTDDDEPRFVRARDPKEYNHK
ncbi:MAG: hypothetical protein V4710_22795 [Verrucomicrobiota bacterium]